MNERREGDHGEGQMRYCIKMWLLHEPGRYVLQPSFQGHMSQGATIIEDTYTWCHGEGVSRVHAYNEQQRFVFPG